MTHYDISQKLVIMFFVMFTINVLFTPNYFQQTASAYNEVPKYDGEIIFPESNNTVINTNHTIYMKPIQNINVNTNHTSFTLSTQNTTYNETNPIQGFSNIVCKSGYQYVQMTGQYTAGDISYKVIFLRMILLDNDGNAIAKGFGFIDDIDAHITKTFNAVTRYPSTFSSCIIQIDGTIPK